MAENLSNSTNSEELYTAVAEVGAVRRRRSLAERSWIVLKKAPPTAWFGMIVFFCYMFVALLHPGWPHLVRPRFFLFLLLHGMKLMFSAPIRSVVISSHA